MNFVNYNESDASYALENIDVDYFKEQVNLMSTKQGFYKTHSKFDKKILAHDTNLTNYNSKKR